MELIFDSSRKSVIQKGIVCPVCAREGNIVEDDIESYYVWCTCCRNWFELGFQTHSEDN